MKANKRQWIFGLCMAALMIVSSLSMPALAERMIAAAEDNVQVDAAQGERRRSTVMEGDAAEPGGYDVSDEAKAVLEEHGRKAFQDVFGIEIPQDYRAIDRQAYEEEGDIGYILSLMPKDWEASVDALAVPVEQSFYTIQFGGVNVETGEAKLLGLQRSFLGWDKAEVQDVEYTTEQIGAMEKEARAFAIELGMDALELAGVDKVSGSYPPGCILTFSMAAGKTLSVTVSEQGEISGYSLVAGKG